MSLYKIYRLESRMLRGISGCSLAFVWSALVLTACRSSTSLVTPTQTEPAEQQATSMPTPTLTEPPPLVISTPVQADGETLKESIMGDIPGAIWEDHGYGVDPSRTVPGRAPSDARDPVQRDRA